MELYSKKEFCSMVGVQFSSLRYYEKIGLLKPKKDEHNKYRQYTHFDAFLLNRFKHYRSIGFSIEDSLDLTSTRDKKYVIKKLNNKEEEIQKEILLLNKQLERIDYDKLNLKRFMHEERSYRIEYLDSKLFLPASEGLNFKVSDYHLLSKFVDLLPITSYCSRFKKEAIENEIYYERDFGLAIDQKDLKLLEVNVYEKGELLTLGKCLSFYSNQLSTEQKAQECINRSLVYMNENGYELNGDIYVDGLKVSNEDGSKIYRIYIPIKQKIT